MDVDDAHEIESELNYSLNGGDLHAVEVLSNRTPSKASELSALASDQTPSEREHAGALSDLSELGGPEPPAGPTRSEEQTSAAIKKLYIREGSSVSLELDAGSDASAPARGCRERPCFHVWGRGGCEGPGQAASMGRNPAEDEDDGGHDNRSGRMAQRPRGPCADGVHF